MESWFEVKFLLVCLEFCAFESYHVSVRFSFQVIEIPSGLSQPLLFASLRVNT